jgi:alkaline phosphatase D
VQTPPTSALAAPWGYVAIHDAPYDIDDALEIGAIDDRSVRVWTRSTRGPVHLTLSTPGRPDLHASVSPTAASDWTAACVLALASPAPGQPFVVRAASHRRAGVFAPAPGTAAALTFAFGSCHEPFAADGAGHIVRAPGTAIYPAMLRDLERANARLLLLVGDQIYSDDVPGLDVRAGYEDQPQAPPPIETLVDAYRRVTRVFFGEAGLRALRERFPTLMIWDDHDIFDNWGSRLEKTPLDWVLFAAAARVYREYQHPRNPSDATAPPFGYRFVHGDIGFLVLDVRGARDWEHGQLLGREQWEQVDQFLHAETSDVSTLFVVSSIPIAHVSRWMAELFDRLPGDNGNAVRDRWCAGRFVTARDALLEDLFDWQAASPVRQVVLLSGDVHAASAFTIRRRRDGARIGQLTSSAMTTTTSRMVRAFNAVAVQAPNLFESRYHFHRHFFSIANNYGLVRLTPLPGGGHRVQFRARGWQPRERRLTTVGRLTLLAAVEG